MCHPLSSVLHPDLSTVGTTSGSGWSGASSARNQSTAVDGEITPAEDGSGRLAQHPRGDQRVIIQNHEIRDLSWFERAEAAVDSERSGAVDRGDAQRLDRFELDSSLCTDRVARRDSHGVIFAFLEAITTRVGDAASGPCRATREPPRRHRCQPGSLRRAGV